MTDIRACVTNDLELIHPIDRPRPCIQKVYDETTSKWVPSHYAACLSPDTCRGCVPRAATSGMLCHVCTVKLEDALSRVGDMVKHLRSVEQSGQALSERVDTSAVQRLVIPDSWIAGDGLMEALGAPPIPSTADIEETFRLVDAALTPWVENTAAIVNTREGAKRAVVLIKRLQTCVKRWPNAEVLYRFIPWFICTRCMTRGTLWRRSPVEQGDDIIVECSTTGCGWAQDWFEWVKENESTFDIFRDAWEREQAERDAT